MGTKAVPPLGLWGEEGAPPGTNPVKKVLSRLWKSQKLEKKGSGPRTRQQKITRNSSLPSSPMNVRLLLPPPRPSNPRGKKWVAQKSPKKCSQIGSPREGETKTAAEGRVRWVDPVATSRVASPPPPATVTYGSSATR